MWKRHRKICLVLSILAIPIFLFDYVLLGPGGGDFISLNFRGFFILPYIFFLILHVGISTVGLFYFRQLSLPLIHLCSALLAVLVLVFSFLAINKMHTDAVKKAYALQMQKRKLLADNIELKRWWFVPNEADPKEIHVEVIVTDSGRFSGGVEGRKGSGMHSKHIFASNNTQRMVKANEHFTHVFTLEKYNPGQADNIEITLYLFKDSKNLEDVDITKIFTKSFSTKDDGTFFYGFLPPPSNDD